MVYSTQCTDTCPILSWLSKASLAYFQPRHLLKLGQGNESAAFYILNSLVRGFYIPLKALQMCSPFMRSLIWHEKGLLFKIREEQHRETHETRAKWASHELPKPEIGSILIQKSFQLCERTTVPKILCSAIQQMPISHLKFSYNLWKQTIVWPYCLWEMIQCTVSPSLERHSKPDLLWCEAWLAMQNTSFQYLDKSAQCQVLELGQNGHLTHSRNQSLEASWWKCILNSVNEHQLQCVMFRKATLAYFPPSLLLYIGQITQRAASCSLSNSLVPGVSITLKALHMCSSLREAWLSMNMPSFQNQRRPGQNDHVTYSR